MLVAGVTSASAFIVDVSTAQPGGPGMWFFNTACGPIIVTSSDGNYNGNTNLTDDHFTNGTFKITTSFGGGPAVIHYETAVPITINGSTTYATATATSAPTPPNGATPNEWIVSVGNGTGITAIEFQGKGVLAPEPSSALLGSVLLGTLFLRRRR